MITATICPICKGWTKIDYSSSPYGHTTILSVSIPQCTCKSKSEGAPKHEGDLGEHIVGYTYGDVEIEKILNDQDHPVKVCISPKEALSLRDWLIQESTELERLAKEQKG